MAAASSDFPVRLTMSAQPQRLLSPEEYLAIERDVATKHEFYRGEMFAMGGASFDHTQITVAASASLYDQLKDGKCHVSANDLRVKVSASGLYTYPDIVVTCEKPRFEDDKFDTLLNPQSIVEVLSDSTEKYDRGKKFELYRQIESLREYVLVSQDRAHIEVFTRDDDGPWRLREATGLESTVELPAIGCQLALADVYAKVSWATS
jgi:Uma2 family endonuclease